MKYTDIPQLTKSGSYQVNVPLSYIERNVEDFINELGLILEPDFQRGHVWTKEQKIKYVEFLLKGGKSARIIYFNAPWWKGNKSDYDNVYHDFVIVDGLQRLTAVLDFLQNRIQVFGLYRNEFEGRIPIDIDLIFNVNNLKTRAAVLQWYIEMNSGGTPHTTKEIERVKKLLEEERNKRLSNKDSVNNET